MNKDFGELGFAIGRGNDAASCEAFLRPELVRMKNSFFSLMANTKDSQDLLRLSGAALVVESLLASLDAALEEGAAAQQAINQK